MIRIRTAALSALLLAALPATAPAQGLQCPPGSSNDACDQWQFEQADRALKALVEDKLLQLDRRSAIQARTAQAKSLLEEAQRQWERFRDAECEARAAANMISARTRQGLTAACLLALTRKRIEDIKTY